MTDPSDPQLRDSTGILSIKSDQGQEIEIVDEESGRVVTRIVAPK